MQPYLVAPGRIADLARLAAQWKGVVLDCETTGTNPWLGDKLLGIGIADPYGEDCYYIPTGHPDWPQTSIVELGTLKAALAGKPVLGHNIKFDLHASREVFEGFPGSQLNDTMVMARIMSVEERPILALDAVVGRELDYEYQSEAAGKESQFGKGKFSCEQIGMKCCEDLDCTRRLYLYFKEKMPDSLRTLFMREVRLTRVLYEMEDRGIVFSPNTLKEQDELLEALKSDVQKDIQANIGKPDFNPRSNPQVTNLMAELGIEPLEYGEVTKKGDRNPRWNREVLKHIKHPVAKSIAQYRALGYEQSYFLAWLKRCPEQVLHGSYNNAVTVTGRLSSSNPNLQNMPRGWLQMKSQDGIELLEWDEKGQEHAISIRKIFVPRPGYVFLICDYKQVELYVGAFYLRMMGDKSFLRLLGQEDLHAATAQWLLGADPADPLFPMWRRRAKEFNFGLWYGLGDQAMADRLKCSLEEAHDLRLRWFQKLPGFSKLQRRVRKRLIDQDYVENVFGRRYYLHEDLTYVAVNYLVQGSTGDYVKWRLYYTRPYCQQWGIYPVLTTHDDIVFEVPIDLIGRREVIQPLIDILEEGSPFGMRLPADAQVGSKNLVEKEPLVYA